jgi:dTDP-4-dehydrorhamnose reductase
VVLTRILLFGKIGQLGWELQRTLAPLGEITVLDYPEVDFTHPDSLHAVVRDNHPDLVINAVAYTAVDKAEAETETAQLINAAAPGVLAKAAREMGAGFIHYSTDYVFDGSKGSPYTEEDQPHPVNAYGQTKLEGEREVEQAGGAYWILRTSWVYTTRRDSFVTKVQQWSRSQSTLRMVTDQVGSPTWARMLAEVTTQALVRGMADLPNWMHETRGVYHLGGSGCASRFDWARAILKFDPHPETQLTREVLPALSAEFPTPAQRPLFTALDCTKFARRFGVALPDWQASLRLAMEVP